MKLIVLTAPSGAGKTTIARRLMAEVPGLRFSTSATTRPRREGEADGEDYVFLNEDAFRERVANGDFVEYEEVYPGRFYGTLRSEVERAARAARAVLLDIDVKGAQSVKKLYGERALTIFIRPPNLAVLRKRLAARGTESEEAVRVRLSRARMEMARAESFDALILNDDLDEAVAETVAHVRSFLND